jgi:hypothetical protein
MPIKLIHLILEGEASKEAKRQGLEYMAFGRWGKDGKVTHTTVNGRLEPVKSKSTATKPAVSRSTTPSSTVSNPVTPTTQKQGADITPAATQKPKPQSISVNGETDAGTMSYEEFESTIPKFTEEDESIADNDEESGENSIFSVKNWQEVVDTVEKWKWGGEEGRGAWGFDGDEREQMFDVINKNIRETGATVSAPRLHRGISFTNSESAQTFLEQFVPGQSLDLPPCGWAPDASTSMQYGPDDPSEPEISAMIELEAGDTPIKGLATTKIERNMGMDVQREIITPGDVKYEVREVKRHTVTRNGRTQTIYKIVLRQSGYTNEAATPKQKYYALLGFMGGNMAMARNIRQKYNLITKNS